MGNLDFLEKKPRIVYTLSWDGITEGKDKATSSLFSLYNFSNEEYSLQGLINANSGLEKSIDEFINAASVSYTFDINTNFDIILTNSEFKEYSVPRATLWKHAENATTEKDYIGKQIGLIFIDFMVNKEYSLFLAYSFVEGSSCTDGYYGPAFGPTFNKVGWYIGAVSMKDIPVGEIGYIKNSMPLVSINYSGKGFTSPQKPYRYASRSFDSDDVISIFYDPNIIPDTNEAKSKGFNAICAPGDRNTKADIKLNKDLADILKAGYIGCLNIYIYNDMFYVFENAPFAYRPFISISYENINSIVGLCIRDYNTDNNTVIYFNPSISREEYNIWRNKYFSSEP